MRRTLVTIAVGIVLFGVSVAAEEPQPGSKAEPANEGRTTGSVGIAAGVKILDEGWEPLGDQTAFVVKLTIGKTHWPALIAIDYASAEAREVDVTGFPLFPPFCCFSTAVRAESETTEWDLGVRRGFRAGKKFRPYLGGGVAFIDGELRVPAQNIFADESTTGYWLDAGFRAPAGSVLEWGIDLRYSDGDIDLGSGKVEAGGPQYLLYFGFPW